MMRKITFDAFVSVFVVLFALFYAVPALAHGGEPRLEISLERINPGGVIELRGVDFDYDEPVVLSLMRSQIQIPLMEVIADGEGVFTQVIVLPPDLPAGEYNFRAQSDHHLVMSPPITVWGLAVEEEESGGNRDQSDVQLGPMPTFAPDIVSTPISQTRALEPPASKGSSSILIYSMSLVTGIIALLGIRMLKKR